MTRGRSTRNPSSQASSALPPGVRIHGRWYQKRPHRGANWANLTEVADGTRVLHQELARREALAAAAASVDEIPVTLTELIARAIENKESKGLAETTLKGYQSLAEGPIAASLGRLPWRSVTRGMIASFLEAALKAGRTTSGNRARAVMSLAFTYAITKEWTEFNPCRGTELNPPTGELTGKHAARAVQFQTRYVPKDEFLTVYNKLSEWHQDVLACAHQIGVRQSDLLYLTRGAIRDGSIYIKERKTARGTRKSLRVIMSADVRLHVERALARQTTIANRPQEVLRPRSGKVARRRKVWPESIYVFCNSENKRITQSALRAAIHRVSGEFDFRDIRATCVTDDEAEKAEAGIVAANILGHTPEMLALYQQHTVKRSDGHARGELPSVLGVRPQLRVVQGRSM